MKNPRDRAPGSLIPRRFLYLVGVLSGVKALGLVLLAESIARGVAAVAVGDPGWRDALLWGVLAGLLRAGAAWATSVVATRAAIGTKESLRAGLADALVSGAPRVGSSATLATRGLDDLDDYFTSVLPAMTNVAVIPLLVGARILFADWLSAVVLIVTVPLVPIFMILVGQFTKERTDAAATALDRLSDHIVELAQGLPVLVGLGRVQEQAAALARISDDYRKRTMATLRTAFLSALVLELIATLSVAVVAVLIGVRILGGGLTLEVGLLVLVLAPEAYTPFRELGSAFHASRTGVAALGRARDLIDQAVPVRPTTASASISADRFTVSYDSRLVLAPINFTLPSAGVTALLGASGSGKSTLIRALAGRLHADADAAGDLSGTAGRSIAWAPQHPHTVADTVRGELALYAEGAPAERVEALLDRLGLLPLADDDPARLSPGEVRRLAVARALIRVDAGATLVLLDEPTAHLDDASAQTVLGLIADAGMRAGVVVASHDAALASIAGQVIQLGAAGDLRDRADSIQSPTVVVERDEDLPPAPRPRAALRALRDFLRPSIGRFAFAALLGTLASAFAVALTATSAWLIVRASEQPAVMYLLVAIVGVRFFGLGRAALRYSERLVTHDAVFDAATFLRLRLWHSLARRGASSRVLQRGGTALDYLVAATDDVRDLVPRTLTPIVVGLLVGAGALLTVFLLLPAAVGTLALLLLVTVVGAPLVAILADRAAERDRLLLRTGVLRRFAALLQAADDLRGNGLDGLVRADLAERDRTIGRASRRVAVSRGLGVAVVVLACCFGAVAMLDLTAPIVLSGAFPVEVAAVLVLLPIALIEPMLGLVAAVQLAPALAVALTRTSELDAPDAPRGTATLGGPVTELELDEVAATWPAAASPAFAGASARVRTGEWLVVEGPSGSGKSTMLSVLLGALPASHGRVLLDGVDLATLDPDDLHRHVAWCPQDAHLFDSTVRANLLLGRPRDDAPSEQELDGALRTAGLGRLLDALTNGLDTRIGSEGSHLSGGERQRLAIARTLLSRASVILLDEPTAHLDDPTARALMSDLRRVFDDRIVVLVTHHAEESLPGDVALRLGGARVPV